MSWPSIASLLWGNHRRSKSTALVSTGGIFLCTKTSMFGHSPIQNSIGGVFHLHFFSRQVGKDWGRICLTLLVQQKSGETTNNSDPHHWHGVGESDLGLVTVFCHPNQARMEVLWCPLCTSMLHPALHPRLQPPWPSCPCQYDSSECVVVVRRYSNTPYIPRGTSHALYMDIGTFFGVHCINAFPFRQAAFVTGCFQFSETDILLPSMVGGDRFEDVCHHLPEFLWDSLEEEHHLSGACLSVISLASSCFASGRVHTDQGRIRQQPCLHPDRRWVRLVILLVPRQKGWGITLPINFCRKPSRVRAQLECMRSSRRHRNWLKNANITEPNRPGGMQGGGSQMIDQTDATLLGGVVPGELNGGH